MMTRVDVRVTLDDDVRCAVRSGDVELKTLCIYTAIEIVFANLCLPLVIQIYSSLGLASTVSIGIGPRRCGERDSTPLHIDSFIA